MNSRSVALILIAVSALTACEEPVIPSDPANAELYRACHGGDSQACVSLGENYENGRRVGWKPDRAIALYEKACAAGYADGCRRAGFFWTQGQGLLQADHERAAKHLRKACDAELTDACIKLAAMHHNGPIRRDQRLAVKLYQRACDLKSGEACLSLAAMYRSGDRVKVNLRKASVLLSKGCELGAGRACLLLGEHYFLGWGVARNTATGIDFLRRACVANDTVACDALKGGPRSGQGTANGTKSTWKQMQAAPSAADVFAKGEVTYDEAIRRLERFQTAYADIDCRKADPELCEYITAWRSWANDMIVLCRRDRRRQQTAAEVEMLAGLLGAMFEDNSNGDRDGASLDRGMERGRKAGRSFADIMNASGNQQTLRDGAALGARARQLAEYQDALALRLEMTYSVFLPPPKR